MTILTPQEIDACFDRSDGTRVSVAKEIERAIYEKAAQRSGLDPIGEVREDCNGHPWKRIGYLCASDLAVLPEGAKVYAAQEILAAQCQVATACEKLLMKKHASCYGAHSFYPMCRKAPSFRSGI